MTRNRLSTVTTAATGGTEGSGQTDGAGCVARRAGRGSPEGLQRAPGPVMNDFQLHREHDTTIMASSVFSQRGGRKAMALLRSRWRTDIDPS